MTKNKLFIAAIVTLLVTNLLLLGFMVFRKPPHPQIPGPKKIIVESLHFDKSQEQQFEKLIDSHRQKIKKLREDLNKAKSDLYKTLAIRENNELETDSYLSTISAINSKIEVMHYNHFLDIKKICKEDQLQDFKVLTSKMAELFNPQPPMKR